MAEPTTESTTGEPERVEAILRRYGVAERDIGRCCDDLSPHFRPPGSPRGRRYTDPSPWVPAVGTDRAVADDQAEHETAAPSVHEALTDVLDGWPIGEPCQEISRNEAIELSTFTMESLARRGITLSETFARARSPRH